LSEYEIFNELNCSLIIYNNNINQKINCSIIKYVYSFLKSLKEPGNKKTGHIQ